MGTLAKFYTDTMITENKFRSEGEACLVKELAPSFGLGLNYAVRDDILLNTEFISYVSSDDFSASVFSLGILFY